MANTKQRFIKIEWLKKAISTFFKEKPKDEISKKKLIAEYCLAFNSTERTGKELLRILEETGFIKIEGDGIRK